MTKAERERQRRIRTLVAKLYVSAGCSCCRDRETYDATARELGQLLDVPEYRDGSGHNFYDVADGKA